MALKQADFVGAIARLNDLTRRQVIKWSPCAVPALSLASLRDPASVMPRTQPKLSFETNYEGRILRITQYELMANPLLPGPYKYTLDVRDENGNVTFEFPDVEGIADLFRSVQTQELDIEGFIKKLVAG